MADWIKWVGGLEDRAEVIAIAQRLNLPPAHVAGCCCILWLWARQEGRVKGNHCHVRHATLESCDRQVAVQGFAAAMQAAEWLIVEDGGLSFPRWNTHNSDSAKARALAAQRQAKYRNARITLPSRSRNARPSPEKRRVDKNKDNPPLPPHAGGAPIDKTGYREAVCKALEVTDSPAMARRIDRWVASFAALGAEPDEVGRRRATLIGREGRAAATPLAILEKWDQLA